MSGRRPTATATLVLAKGKLYGDQKERAENEPQAVAVVEPRCPSYFRDSEKEAWNDIAEILKNYSLFLDVNAPLLELGAMLLADIRNSYWEILRRGKTVKGPNGENWRNPAIRDRYKSSELLIKVLSDLNVSASGVAKLGAALVQGRKRKSEMEDLLD